MASGSLLSSSRVLAILPVTSRKLRSATFFGGTAQSMSHLLTDGVENFWMTSRVIAEIAIGNFSQFIFSFGANAGTTGFFIFKQAHFSKKVARIQIGNNSFLAFLIFEDYRHRTRNYVIQGFTLITLMDDSSLVWLLAPMGVA